MFSILKIYDEKELMVNLIHATFLQIKNTKTLPPIKLLIDIYDILSLVSSILDKFTESDSVTFDSMWKDRVSLKQLNKLRCELTVYHRQEFESLSSFEIYGRQVQQFISLVELRLNNMSKIK